MTPASLKTLFSGNITHLQSSRFTCVLHSISEYKNVGLQTTAFSVWKLNQYYPYLGILCIYKLLNLFEQHIILLLLFSLLYDLVAEFELLYLTFKR